MEYLAIYAEDEMYHHGIKGQKWGVRRYQNPDGSLTAEGRKRYLDSKGNFTELGRREYKTDYVKGFAGRSAKASAALNAGIAGVNSAMYLASVAPMLVPYMGIPAAAVTIGTAFVAGTASGVVKGAVLGGVAGAAVGGLKAENVARGQEYVNKLRRQSSSYQNKKK